MKENENKFLISKIYNQNNLLYEHLFI